MAVKKTTTIDLMRHGEPIGGRRYRGQIDDPLSEKGWAEMRHATAHPPSWDIIISSPLKRCKAFAVKLSQELAIEVRIDQRLQEVGFGSWEGHTADQLRAQDPDQLSQFYHDPINNQPPGAESLEPFCHRVQQAYTQAVANHAGQHILLIAHAGVIRAILTQLLHAPPASMYRISIPSASISRIEIGNEKPPTIQFIGKTSLIS